MAGPDISWRPLKNYRLRFQALFSHTDEQKAGLSAYFKAVDTSVAAIHSLVDSFDDDTLYDTTFSYDTLTFDNGNYTIGLDGESFDGHALFAGFEREARLWNFNVEFEATSPTFRADHGEIRRNDLRILDAWTGLSLRPNGNVITTVTPQFDLGRIWNYQGTRKDEWLRWALSVNLRKQTRCFVDFLVSRELWREVWFDDIRRFGIEINNQALDEFEFGMYFGYGNTIARHEVVMGRVKQFGFWADIKPWQQLTIEPSFSYYKLNDRDKGVKLYEGTTLNTRVNYQFTKELFIRTIIQYNDFDDYLSLEPLVTYRLNPFTIFYIGSSHSFNYEIGDSRLRKTSRQFFLKFQYLFQV